MPDAADNPDDLDASVRRADPDRWLASRFVADPQARADVIALYALNDELARVAPVVSNPLIGEIRLAWWREAVDEMFEGRLVRRHPVADALARAIGRRALPRDLLDAMIEARHADLEPAPFNSEADLFAYLDATAGALMTLGAGVLGAPDAATHVRDAGRAWGVAGLARSHWAGAPNRLPADWSAQTVRETVAAALARARGAAARLPVPAFPAVAYACLAGPYARKQAPDALGRQARILWAVARGSL